MTGNRSERGIALVITLFLMSALSVLAAAMMFLSQTETYASMNYRRMSQARYAAESAVQRASNFLLTTQYTMPNTGTDMLFFHRELSPVTRTTNNAAVVLSAVDSQAPNYPVDAVQTAFYNAAKGELTAGSGAPGENNVTLTYGAYAKLLHMQIIEAYGGGQVVVQTWEVTGRGGLKNSPNATVEVSSVIETPKVPASSYAVFATDDTCGALDFTGDVTINSYDSTSMSGMTAPTFAAFGGDVGTNGNLSIGGSVAVDGNLYTPRTGVGKCTAGAVTGLSVKGTPLEPKMVTLPAPLVFPTPPVPAYSTLPPTGPINGAAGACALLGFPFVSAPAATCTESGSNITIDGHGTTVPAFPQVTLGSSTNLVLVANFPAAQYAFNSLELNGGATIRVSATDPMQNAFVNVIGKDNTGVDIAPPADVLNLVGGTFASPVGCATCSDYDASMLQFIYAGSGNVALTGNSGAAATFYMPNADVTFEGTADLYGSVLGRHVHNVGMGNIHYDRRLKRDYYVAGHPMLSTFTWKRY